MMSALSNITVKVIIVGQSHPGGPIMQKEFTDRLNLSAQPDKVHAAATKLFHETIDSVKSVQRYFGNGPVSGTEHAPD